MRHIILDTETTGLSVKEGHRIIEIGALEMVNYALTGVKLHLYINPEREIDEGAQAVHGIASEFLKDKPVFSEIADQFLGFIGSDILVIHNAPFDVGFLNDELKNCEKPVLKDERIIDTLTLARQKFPGAQASLDALCRRFQIDNSHRDLHGALIDADLLADVFVELKGGKQPGLGFQEDTEKYEDSVQSSLHDGDDHSGFKTTDRTVRPARIFVVPAEEEAAHNALLDEMRDPIWRQVLTETDKEKV